ncbi:MAG: hypothetical protein GY679_00955 [Mycoplasma sp.]|nr:hypothetical protein [Mycoplasma sp.]
MKKLLIAVLLLSLISCENEPIRLTYKISSMIPIDNGAWEGCDGLTYKVTINDIVSEDYTKHVGIFGHVELLDGDYIELEAWADNPEASVNIKINHKSDKKKKYNYKRIDN